MTIDRNGDRDLFLLDVASLAVSPLTSREGEDHNPHFLPDGATIAFVTGRWPKSTIWLAAPDGSNRRRLVN